MGQLQLGRRGVSRVLSGDVGAVLVRLLLVELRSGAGHGRGHNDNFFARARRAAVTWSISWIGFSASTGLGGKARPITAGPTLGPIPLWPRAEWAQLGSGGSPGPGMGLGRGPGVK